MSKAGLHLPSERTPKHGHTTPPQCAQTPAVHTLTLARCRRRPLRVGPVPAEQRQLLLPPLSNRPPEQHHRPGGELGVSRGGSSAGIRQPPLWALFPLWPLCLSASCSPHQTPPPPPNCADLPARPHLIPLCYHIPPNTTTECTQVPTRTRTRPYAPLCTPHMGTAAVSRGHSQVPDAPPPAGTELPGRQWPGPDCPRVLCPERQQLQLVLTWEGGQKGGEDGQRSAFCRAQAKWGAEEGPGSPTHSQGLAPPHSGCRQTGGQVWGAVSPCIPPGAVHTPPGIPSLRGHSPLGHKGPSIGQRLGDREAISAPGSSPAYTVPPSGRA